MGPPGSIAVEGSFRRLRSYLGLRSIRRLLATRRARLLAVLLASAYGVVSLFVGLMIQSAPANLPASVHLIAQAPASDWWDYPALIVNAPGWVLFLPFLPTATMVLVSIAVGLSMAASLVLVAARLRARRADVTAGAGAGVAPAVAGLATLGACCCTACTATLSVGVIASVSGTDLFTLLANNWYLDIFQLAIVGVSLVALERGLRQAEAHCAPSVRLDGRFWAGAVLRFALLLAGITWSLAMLVEWSVDSPLAASAAQWYHWIFEHQLLSLVAIGVALFPGEAVRLVSRFRRSGTMWAARGALFIAGFTWGVWVPPFLTTAGLGGFLNEFFGLVGLPASWGAIPLDAAVGAPLLFHWLFQHLLLAGYAMLLATRPEWALAPLAWTMGLPSSGPARTSDLTAT